MENLNKEQLKAVIHKDGPLLIVAGAGTGKTTVITQRIAYMIEQGWTKSDEILALTFTEKAAGEMEERVDRLLPMGYLDLWISTFHSFGERILKEHGLDIGLPNDFKLLNEFEQYALIKNNLDKFDLDYYRPMGNPTKFINALIKHFSRLKDEDISPAQYLEYAGELKENLDGMLSGGKKVRSKKLEVRSLVNKDGVIDKDIAVQEVARINEVANAYHVYQQLLLDSNALDFGDLINYGLKLFRQRPAILEKYRKQFKYILLDEFQDTNWAQYELIKMIASPKNNLVVVGDDDQCLPGDRVVLTKLGKKRIDRIRVGEEVATAVGKGYLSYSKVNQVNRNNKKVRLLTFRTKNGNKITVTDNHKMFCFIPSSQRRPSGGKRRIYYYVYLMHKKELGWRLGITRDLAVRLRLERSADRIVAIQAFGSEEEARYNEALLSLRYGIPTVCFQEREGMMTKNKWSEKLYKDLDVEKNVIRLADDLGINLEAHQVCLDGVNRGKKVRIKINLEMCHRNYRSKFAKGIFLKNPKVEHLLSVETSHQPTLKKLERLGFRLSKAKKGKRLRLASTNLFYLGEIAKKIERETGGIIENSAKIGRTNMAHKKALIIPASNILPGMFLPVVAKKGIIYEQVEKRDEKIKELAIYDLEIDKTHNFIADDVVVHNSIYKFRGASVSNILQFKKDYPQAEQIFLVNNYRNKQNILDLSYKFIKQNDPNRLEYQLNKKAITAKAGQGKQESKKTELSKKLVADNKGEGVIEIIEGKDLNEEIRLIIEKIADLKIKDKNSTWDDFAILVRANESAKEICSFLAAAELPYQFLSSRGLYTKPVIMDIIAYLKLLDDYHESIAAYRVLNLPVFNFTYNELVNFNYWANKKAWSLYEILRNVSTLNLGIEVQKKADTVLSLIAKHTVLTREKNVGEVILSFLNDSGYLKYLTSQDEQKSRETASYLNQFMKRAGEFEKGSDDKSVKAFLNQLQMEIDAGEEGTMPVDLEAGPETIKVMTAHGAKGLEFKYVFIAGLVDKRFPTIERSEQIAIPDALVKEILPEGDIHLEEERRLFYVAMTRAKSDLYFSWAPDYGGVREKKPSRFLKECGLVQKSKKARKQENKDFEANILETKTFVPKKSETAGLVIPSYFSYTQLAAFSNCPYQYRFAHILRIPVRGKHVFSFGKTLHITLQKLFSLVEERKKREQTDLFGSSAGSTQATKKNVKISLEEILKLYEQSWIDDWYKDKTEKERHRKKGKEILKQFYEKYQGNWPNAIFLEKGFNTKVKVGDELYTVRGVIDRIDEVDGHRQGEAGHRGNGASGTGKIKIIDYKTGNPKDKLIFEEKYQLLIYQLAAKEIFRQEIDCLAFYYLDNNTEVKFLGSEDELEKTKEKIVATIAEIKKGEFPPRPSALCRFCDFFEICEFRKS